ncbi:MAG: restriction endonuclease subunit S [Akkermansiaceae bacterium]|nr:restriction endonuclease subunit S [Akkermansiaceae bacterium]
MMDLTKHKFSELYAMSSGISTGKDQAGHGSPFVSFTSVFNNYFLPTSLPDLMSTSEKEQETYSVKEGDIFLTRTSETLDELGMSCVVTEDYPKATYSGFLKRLRPSQSKKAYHKYMAFYLRSGLFRKTMNNNAVMTLRCSLNEQIFSYLNLLLPNYDEQVKVGDFLYLIHQKMELNKRINAELEGMAKLLYDYWFVQFEFPVTAAQAAAMGKPHLEGKPYKSSGGKMIYDAQLKRDIPEGWQVGNLPDIATFTNGIACQKYPPNGGDTLRVIKIREMRDGFTQNSETVTSEVPAKVIVHNGDILFSWSASLEVMLWAGGKGALNQHIFRVTSATYPRSFCYFTLLNYLQHFKMIAELRKTTMGHITKDHLDQSRIAIPPLELTEQLDAKLNLIIEQTQNLHQQNQHLTTLRDWLLPMLMNGQVTVE